MKIIQKKVLQRNEVDHSERGQYRYRDLADGDGERHHQAVPASFRRRSAGAGDASARWRVIAATRRRAKVVSIYLGMRPALCVEATGDVQQEQ
jgi:hypothetical protein